MRPLDQIRNKKRFIMFSEKSKDKVLEVNNFFDKYSMHFEESIKKTFTYYDTPDQDLLKSNIVLYKTQIGKFTELNMATEKSSTTVRYTTISNNKHFSILIKPHDSILKHKDFLIESFKKMFMSSISFDPEFLMKKLRVSYIIKTVSKEYRSMNVTGLKITYSFDRDVYLNTENNKKTIGHVLTIYQHSPEKTDADFEDLIGKLTRYCKELTPTNNSKIMIARELTQTKTEPTTLDQSKLDKMKKKNKK